MGADTGQKAETTPLSKWREMVFTSRFKNLRILDPKNLKKSNLSTGETTYGTEIVFKNVGGMGFYNPKSRREAEILLGCGDAQLQGASPVAPVQSEQVVAVVTAPHPEGVFSGKP